MKAPRSAPNSSAAASSGATAPRFTATKGPPRRPLVRWMAWATSSLPVPVSPRRSTGTSRSATCWMSARTRWMPSLSPTSPRSSAPTMGNAPAVQEEHDAAAEREHGAPPQRRRRHVEVGLHRLAAVDDLGPALVTEETHAAVVRARQEHRRAADGRVREGERAHAARRHEVRRVSRGRRPSRRRRAQGTVADAVQVRGGRGWSARARGSRSCPPRPR